MKKSDKTKAPEVENRKARHLYQVLETLEVGVVLVGTEVKSIREGKIQLGEAWIDVTNDQELFLVNSYIEEYSLGNQFNHKSDRKRKLLAHRHEILKFHKAKELKGLTIVPLKLYFKAGKVKLLIGLCRGKDHSDKRQDLMRRQQKIEVDRALKNVKR